MPEHWLGVRSGVWGDGVFGMVVDLVEDPIAETSVEVGPGAEVFRGETMAIRVVESSIGHRSSFRSSLWTMHPRAFSPMAGQGRGHAVDLSSYVGDS
ncbi:hypothetical protein ADL26_15240 [Thermoactinomyces vulgaris]|nr:hypothetical protein ADL26_15240 [Thermoactinomyces vulgaris]